MSMGTLSKRTLLGITAILMLAVTITVVARSATGKQAQFRRGEYLVTVLGCNDCHTPWRMGPGGPEPDLTRILSGHPEEMVMPEPPDLGDEPWQWVGAATNTAFAGPWGISYAANLTPDQNTGLGIWTEERFMNALRLGKHWGQSRPILPPMPWFNFARLTDADLKAVWVYLRTREPITNHVPESVTAEEIQDRREAAGITVGRGD